MSLQFGLRSSAGSEGSQRKCWEATFGCDELQIIEYKLIWNGKLKLVFLQIFNFFDTLETEDQ